MRVVSSAPIQDGPRIFADLSVLMAREPEQTYAPVLSVPRVLEPALCRRLIDLYERQGGYESGFMRQDGGQTVGKIDHSFKRRADSDIDDQELRDLLGKRIRQRLVPEIQRAFQFKATRIERWIVACYDADSGGFFRPHRDNTTSGTAHRKFACTINLNADEFEGGELRFPEYGPRSYRAPTGGAVVFSCSLLHEALPVTRGKRYAFLPFLYDDEGAQIREKNMSTIVPLHGAPDMAAAQ
jgi:predicted 2-oxoglutarate/Fe(II)-dependent dioxygenase YbiX